MDSLISKIAGRNTNRFALITVHILPAASTLGLGKLGYEMTMGVDRRIQRTYVKLYVISLSFALLCTLKDCIKQEIFL